MLTLTIEMFGLVLGPTLNQYNLGVSCMKAHLQIQEVLSFWMHFDKSHFWLLAPQKPGKNRDFGIK